MNTENVDVLVIGAGPSGAVAAGYLHKHGIHVKVVEKAQFPRFVIGESLIPRCMDHFQEAGLLNSIITKNYEKKYGARFIKDETVCLFDFSKKFSEGWNWTWQVPRADFDKCLTDHLQSQGVDISFNTEVTDVIFQGSSSITTVKTAQGIKNIAAKFIIDASGYGRVLPRLLNLEVKSGLDTKASVFTHVKDINRPKGKEGALITFDVLDTHVWFWVIPFSDGTTSIGFVAPPDYLERAGKNSTEILQNLVQRSDFFKDRFSEIEYLFPPKKIVGYSKAVKKLYGEGYAITGNSAEFLDPVFSSGVTFATESGLLSAKLITRQLQGDKIDWEMEYSDYIKEGIHVFRTYVEEWYTGNLQKIFFHKPENPDIKQKICAVLAGYVWDKKNPFVKKHYRAVRSIAHLIDMETTSEK